MAPRHRRPRFQAAFSAAWLRRRERGYQGVSPYHAASADCVQRRWDRAAERRGGGGARCVVNWREGTHHGGDQGRLRPTLRIGAGGSYGNGVGIRRSGWVAIRYQKPPGPNCIAFIPSLPSLIERLRYNDGFSEAMRPSPGESPVRSRRQRCGQGTHLLIPV